VPDGALVVILGDHQPPAFVGGAQLPWTVPIHVLSRDPDLLRPFAARLYAPGIEPRRDVPPQDMADLLGMIVAGFGPAPPDSVNLTSR
jgi:hypothetical protein